METNSKEFLIEEHEMGEGHTPAAWTCVIVMLLGFAISAVSMVSSYIVGFFVGIILVCVGLFLGLVLKKLGFGVAGSRLKTSKHK